MGADIESVTLAHAVTLFAEHRILLDGVRTVIFD
jgi:formyltetrahydrofolate hydrolase